MPTLKIVQNSSLFPKSNTVEGDYQNMKMKALFSVKWLFISFAIAGSFICHNNAASPLSTKYIKGKQALIKDSKISTLDRVIVPSIIFIFSKQAILTRVI